MFTRVLLPWGGTMLALAAFAFWLIRTSETNMIGSGSHSLRYVEPAFTFAEVRAIAEGQTRADGESLHDAVMKSRSPGGWFPSPDERMLEVGYSNAPGMREAQFTIGWPLLWYSDWRWMMFGDAARKRDPIAIVSDPTQMGIGPNTSITPDAKFAPRPRWSWNMNAVSYRPPPEETAGVSVWKDLSVLAIAATIGLAMLLGVVAAIAFALLRRLFRRGKSGVSSAKFGGFVATLACVVMIIVAFLTAEHRESARMPSGGPQRTVGRAMPRGLNTQHSTGITESAFDAMADASDRDRHVAQAIMAATNPSLADDQAVLLTAMIPQSEMIMMESSSTSFNRSVGLFSISDERFTRRSRQPHAPMGPSYAPQQLPERTTFPAGTRWTMNAGYFSATRSTGDINEPVRRYTLNLQWLGSVTMAASLLWLLLRSPWLLWRFRLVKRRRRNQCLACGHALGPAPANA